MKRQTLEELKAELTNVGYWAQQLVWDIRAAVEDCEELTLLCDRSPKRRSAKALRTLRILTAELNHTHKRRLENYWERRNRQLKEEGKV